MAALDDKLRGETLLFNGLMYIIMFVGWLVAMLLDIAATFWHPYVSWYVLYVQIGTLAGATLCHYLLHLGYSYSAKRGDGDIQIYEKNRENNIEARIFVVLMNVIFFISMGYLTIMSLARASNLGDPYDLVYRILICLLLGTLWPTFAVCPHMAKISWKFEPDSK